MTEQDLIKFKNLSMQDGRLNLQWFADYVAQAEREECAKLCDARYMGDNNREDMEAKNCAAAIRARSKE
jgi:hypothetical protein